MLIYALIFCFLSANNLVVKEYNYADVDGKHNVKVQLVNTMDKVFNPGAPSYIRTFYTNDKYAKQEQLLLNDSCEYHMVQMKYYPNTARIADLDSNGIKEFVFVYGEAAHLYEEIPMYYCVLTNGKLYKAKLIKKYTDEARAENILTSEQEFRRSLPAMFQTTAGKEYMRIKEVCLETD